MIVDKIIPERWYKSRNGKDSNVKSIVKAVSWRVVGTIDTMLISYLITGRWKLAVSIGGIEVFSKIFLYYLHERVWERFVPAKTDPK